MAEPFAYKVFDEDDDTTDVAYKSILHDLLTGRTTASQAAAATDVLFTEEASSRYEQVKQRNPPFKLTAEEEEKGLTPLLVGPNPLRSIDMLNASLAEICSAFPPAHHNQDALVEFVRALRDLPKHEVPDGDYTADEPSYDRKLTLWPFGTDAVTYLGEKYRREAEDIAYPFSDVETLGSETQLRWSNFQSFVARLTVTNLIDCSRATALSHLLPNAPTYPDLKARRVGGARRIAADLIAASPWLEDDQARRWVYRQCMEVAGTGEDERNLTWSRRKWRTWQEQLGFIAESDLFSEETRSLARSLRGKMDAEG